MSSFKLKKLAKQLSLPVYITLVSLLMVMTYRITRLSMESRFSAIEQRVEAEKAVYEQRIASLLDRLEAGVMTNEGIEDTYNELTELGELMIRLRIVDVEMSKLNNFIYKKLVRRYPESAAKFLMDELQGEHSDWAYRFMLAYVTDEHIRWTCSLSLKNLVTDTDDPILRERAETLLRHYEESDR